MKTFLVSLIVLLSAFAIAASAASVDGKWLASMEGPNGNIEINYTFKADGEKVTGTSSSQFGEQEIQEGKLVGDDLSFVIAFRPPNGGDEFRLQYKGKVSGDTINFSIETPQGTREFTAKKVE